MFRGVASRDGRAAYEKWKAEPKKIKTIDGMEGDTMEDPRSVFQGLRLKNGWKNSGLPGTYDIAPARM